MSATPSTDSLDTLRSGVFAGPTVGLRYETPTVTGLTNDRGDFTYHDGEVVTFLIGRLVIGAAAGAPKLNLADLVSRVDGDISKLHDPGITNLARFVQTLDQDSDLETGVSIAPAAHDVIGSAVIDFDQAFKPGSAEANFASDPTVTGLLTALNSTDGVFTGGSQPRELRAAAAARNELRRNIRGIVKMTDVKIPLRDGSLVLADVFRPADGKPSPVVMNKGDYGKAFDHGCIGDEVEAAEKEKAEDRYFSGNPDGLQYENHESVNTADWVPNGYVTIRVDARGVGHSPGVQAPLGRQEAEDYYDAIEWAAAQPWCNGNVGLWGMSYYAMSQHNVASLQPPHLKAMIAMGTDADSYNEYVYPGGLFSEGFWTWWWNILTKGNTRGTGRDTDWFASTVANSFNEPELYGAHAPVFMTPEIERITTPVWIVGPQSGAALHQQGSSETYIRSTGVEHRKFDFVDGWFPRSYQASTVAEHIAYFDHWLKGIDNGIMSGPTVRVQVRTGNAASYLMHETEWPIARTQYVRYYLDASESTWDGDAHGRTAFRLTSSLPDSELEAGYEAGVDIGQKIFAPIGRVGGTARWATGISFVSDPVDEDMVMVGYLKAGLWVSSTSSDMDLHVSFRVIDEQDREIRYEAVVLPMDPHHIHPLGFGSLKVSHRQLDDARTTEYLPVHTHTRADYQPLVPGEPVEIEVGLSPTTALVRRGCRLRVDVQPVIPAGLPWRAYDESYHQGATNTVYTGPGHPSYVQLPLVPAGS